VSPAKTAPTPAPEFDLGGLSLEPLDEELSDPTPGPVGNRQAPASSSLLTTTLELPVPRSAATVTTLEIPVPTSAATVTTLEIPVPASAATVTTLELPVPAGAATVTTLELPVPASAATVTTLEFPVPEQVARAQQAPALAEAAMPMLDFDFSDAGSSFKFSDFEAAPQVEAKPTQSDDDLMRQFQAIFNDEDYVAPVAQGPIRNVWVLGASIGGPEAVREFLGSLPPETPALFLLAQHMGADFLELMTQQLGKSTRLRVRHVRDGERVAYGDLVIVPLQERLRVDGYGDIRISALEQVSSYTPSIDMVLKDVADAFGGNAGAIIFSGMAHDGIDGTRYLHQKGGLVWVQDPKTCVVSSMVDGACEAGIVEFAGSPHELAKQFVARFPG
jgi:chemotaxis response regulator CheB